VTACSPPSTPVLTISKLETKNRRASLMNKMEAQKKEFDAVEKLAERYRAITTTPIVDDDYPEVRFYYERAVRDVIDAFRTNGRSV
jgi:cation diffusion facilitator CzcD-associated flavoprotein CzcO